MSEKSEMLFKEAQRKSREFITPLIMNNQITIDTTHRTNLVMDLPNMIKQPYTKHRIIDTLTRRLTLNFLGDIEVNSDTILHADGETCFDCGEFIIYKMKNNHISAHENIECCKKAIHSVEIDVPSGKLVFTDWPIKGDEILNHLDKENEHTNSVNYFKGRKYHSDAYAKADIMHFCIGNSNPDIYQDGNTIYIGRIGYNYDTDTHYPLPGEDVGNLSTGLWWATCFDYEVYKKMAQEKGLEKEIEAILTDRYHTITNVEPGRYKCTTFYEIIKDEDGTEPTIYIKMEKLWTL